MRTVCRGAAVGGRRLNQYPQTTPALWHRRPAGALGDCSLEELHYHLYVAETINRRRVLATDQTPVQQKDAVARLEKWLIK